MLDTLNASKLATRDDADILQIVAETTAETSEAEGGDR